MALALWKIKSFDLSQGHCVVQAIFRVFTEKAQIYSTSCQCGFMEDAFGRVEHWETLLWVLVLLGNSFFRLKSLSVGVRGRRDRKCRDGFGEAPYLLCCFRDLTCKKLGKH